MTLIPKVTIAIPTYNRVAFLRQALDSALAQTYQNIEVVVSNNASTDETEKLLSSYSDDCLKVIHQPSNIGMMGNWDACLASASGVFFLLLSDDDVLEKNAISELVAKFCDGKSTGISPSNDGTINEQIGMVWCRSKIINEKNEVLRYSQKAPAEEESFSAISGFFSGERETFPCSVLLRTYDIRQCGGYSAVRLTLIADAYVWIACCQKREKVRFVEECLTSYRVHTNSGTSNATIEEWLFNNSELARLCINYYQTAGEYSKAALINKLIEALNGKVAISLIIQKLHKEGLASFRAIREYFSLCKKYQIEYCLWHFFRESIRIAANSGWLGILRSEIKKLVASKR